MRDIETAFIIPEVIADAGATDRWDVRAIADEVAGNGAGNTTGFAGRAIRGFGAGLGRGHIASPLATSGCIPFMISPGGHVRAVLRPGHDVVKMLVDGRLPMVVTVAQIADAQDKVWMKGANLVLNGADATICPDIADIAFRRNDKGTARGRGCFEGMIRAGQ